MAEKSKVSHDSRVVKLAHVGGESKPLGLIGTGERTQPLLSGGIAFIETGACALVCLYYELSLVLSLIGGLFVLGIALAFKSNNIFDL